MKIILKDDIENLGRFGEVVKVSPGYARNYLIPRGFAVNASPGNLKQVEVEKDAWAKKNVKFKEDAERVAAGLASITLNFVRKTGEGDKLFGSVTSMDVSASLKEKGFNIEKKNIVLPEPIKSLGDAAIVVRLHPQVKAEVKVSVVKE